MTEPKERASLPDLVEEFRIGLISRATGEGMDPARYRELRQTLMAEPSLAPILPQFVRVCRTSDDFWTWIKGEAPTYRERREIINTALKPALEKLDGLETAAAAHLVFGEVLGRGGFGTVYKVRHDLLELDFAAKVFEPAFDDGGEATLRRFFREARLLFSLNHRCIVRIYDVGYASGKPFIRMEYFEGKNFNQFLQDHGTLTPGKAAVLVREILGALVHAHEEVGVIHRDLKPSNVMLAPGERVKVVDFGLGVFVENDLSRITRTGESAVGGYYTAPELVHEPRRLDPRSDLFSVGAIWHTALVGRPPGGSDVSNDLRRAVRLPDRYHAAIMRSLAGIDDRFASASEMLAVVRELE